MKGRGKLTVAQVRLVAARLQAVNTRPQRPPEKRPVPRRAIPQRIISPCLIRIQIPRKNRVLQRLARPTNNTRRVDNLVLVPKPVKARPERVTQVIQQPVVIRLGAVRLLALLEALEAGLELFALVAVAVEGVLADDVGCVGGGGGRGEGV